MSTKATSTAATTKTRKSTGAKTTKKSSGTKRGSSTKRKPGQLAEAENKQPKYEAVDKFQIIANKLLAIMAEGTLPWRRPWWVEPCANLLTGHEYTGLNPSQASGVLPPERDRVWR